MSVMAIPMPTFDAQPIFLQPGRDETMDILKDLQGQLRKASSDLRESARPTAVANPCAKDLMKTGCKDAQCLKRYAESLSGSCAELLLRPVVKRTVPEPSPAPMARGHSADLISTLLGQHELPKMMMRPAPEERRRAEQMHGQGFFTMISTDEEGHQHSFSGPIGSASMPPELAQLAQAMPDLNQLLPELATVFGSFAPSMMLGRPLALERVERVPEPPKERAEPPAKEYPTASIGDDPEEVAAAERVAHHPCGDEIMQCRQIGGHDMASIKKCLLEHLDQLSPRCKCFVNQVEGPEKIQKQLPPSAKAAAAPALHLTASAPSTRVVVLEDAVTVHPFIAPPPRHPVHGGPCIFMMSATLILFALLLRKCIRCFCSSPAAAPTMAVVVPPEQTSIKLVEPLRADEIKMVAVAK